VVGLRRLVIVAGKPSHPPGAHEFRAGARLLARCLQDVPDLVVDVYEQGRLPAPTAGDISAIVVFADGGTGHPILEADRLDALRTLVRKGIGIGFMHYALEVPRAQGGADMSEWIGGFYEDGVSCNPIWAADVEPLPDHPITRGVTPFRSTDEWYIGLSFAPESTVRPILVATPSDEVRAGPYVWPAGPYPHIVAASGRREPLMWAFERPDGGRGFGLTGGHFHANWAADAYRRAVLNALVWMTGAEVPPGGVASQVTAADLERDLDDKG
jgi:Trehalose utilisation